MLTIGSRGSKLALWQAHFIMGKLSALGHECRLEIIKTSGDLITTVPLKEVGNKGIFTKEIEEALLEERIDVAVHSLKDMPTVLPEGLVIAATPEREDVRDALVGSTLDGLARGARVGTGSLRRIAQLKALRPDLVVEGIRGNVDTRLRKLDEGQYDALVLAAAGLRRLSFEDRIGEYIPIELMCPAVGQGALAIETRDDNGAGRRAVAPLNSAVAEAAVAAERAVLAALGGGCEVPIGAHAAVSGDTLMLRAIVISPDGTRSARCQESGSIAGAVALGKTAASILLARGAREILNAA